jgi:hypothetical protein
MTEYEWPHLALDTAYGVLENVPLVFGEYDYAPLVPLYARVHSAKLPPDMIEDMIGAPEWSRQLALLDEWWSLNGGQIIREAQDHYRQRTAAE